jgi:hypothetical protein
VALRKDIVPRWWCPTCEEWIVPQERTDENPGICGRCGRSCRDFDPVDYQLSGSHSEKHSMAVHHYCWTCGYEITNKWLLVPPPGAVSILTLSEWAALMGHALIRRNGKYRHGPIPGWYAWCPGCMQLRRFSCRIITKEPLQKRRRKRSNATKLPKAAVRAQIRMSV